MIEVDQLCVRTSRATLLESVSLTIEPGKVTALLGPNGAGKSTLLGALCGHIPPAHGTVRIDGRPLSAWTSAAVARVRAALLQDSHMAFAFTAFDVALLGRTPHWREAETAHDRAIAVAALRTTQTNHLALRTYVTLSGGERQRVQLARVLAQIWDPPSTGHRYLLLDEPTSHLDLAHQHIILDAARRFARAGTGVLVILHDLSLAAQYADTVVLLSAGRVLTSGRPTAVLTAEHVAQAFGVGARILRDSESPHPVIVIEPPSITVDRRRHI